MRDYGKVYSSVWSSETFRSMSEDGRMLALYLMTSPHTTIAGVFRLPDGYACEDLQWTQERVQQAFQETLEKGFANRCETTKWVWIVKHLDWNPPENPNQRKAAAKCAQSVPDECAWKLEFMRVCGPSIGIEQSSEPNRSLTVVEPFANQEQEQEQEEEPPIPPKGVRTPTLGLKAWLDSLKASGEKPIPPDDAVFAYADEVGIPHDFLRLAWLEFRHQHTQPNAKRYKDWRAHFRNSVRKNWGRLWWIDPASNTYQLTTVGQQAQRAHTEKNEKAEKTKEAA
jgi:hypothetical protein